MPDLILPPKPIGQAFRRCGNCEHTLMLKEDVTKRICKGGPPCLVTVPVRGGIEARTFWPVVEANEAACRVWELKASEKAN